MQTMLVRWKTANRSSGGMAVIVVRQPARLIALAVFTAKSGITVIARTMKQWPPPPRMPARQHRLSLWCDAARLQVTNADDDAPLRIGGQTIASSFFPPQPRTESLRIPPAHIHRRMIARLMKVHLRPIGAGFLNEAPVVTHPRFVRADQWHHPRHSHKVHAVGVGEAARRRRGASAQK